MKTSDKRLYQRLDVEQLREAAAKNKINEVVEILEVHGKNIDDPKPLIIAARKRAINVISVIFAMSSFNPDPHPQENMPASSNTPIRAAIGRENLQVIELFLNQSNFNPTRLVNGECTTKSRRSEQDLSGMMRKLC